MGHTMQTYAAVPPRNAAVNAERKLGRKKRKPKALIAGNMKRGRK